MRKSARRSALLDITKYIIEEGIDVWGENFDTWFVSSSHLDTKKQRNLNRELGVHKVNYRDNSNAKNNNHAN